MDIVTVVNRSSKALEGIFDGRVTVIPPHGRIPMLSNAAEKMKEQNPCMGTEDPADPRSPEFLIGVVEWKDDCSPLEQSDEEERFDRSLVDNGGNKAVKLNLKGGRPSRVKVALDDDNPVGIQVT